MPRQIYAQISHPHTHTHTVSEPAQTGDSARVQNSAGRVKTPPRAQLLQKEKGEKGERA